MQMRPGNLQEDFTLSRGEIYLEVLTVPFAKPSLLQSLLASFPCCGLASAWEVLLTHLFVWEMKTVRLTQWGAGVPPTGPLSFASLLFNTQSAVILYFIEQTFLGYLKVYVLC